MNPALSYTLLGIALVALLTYWVIDILSSDFKETREVEKIKNSKFNADRKLPSTILEGFEDDSEPVSDYMNFREKGDKFTDEELLHMTLARSKMRLEDEISDIELSNIHKNAIEDLDSTCLDDAIYMKQKTKGKNAYRNSRVSFDQVKEDYELDFAEDNEPWWLESDV